MNLEVFESFNRACKFGDLESMEKLMTAYPGIFNNGITSICPRVMPWLHLNKPWRYGRTNSGYCVYEDYQVYRNWARVNPRTMNETLRTRFRQELLYIRMEEEKYLNFYRASHARKPVPREHEMYREMEAIEFALREIDHMLSQF